jgi:tetratricopeptide (TPR) repeat protein
MGIPSDVKIILVGTNAVYRKNVMDMLSMLGYRNIELAKDGPSAWEMIMNTKPGIIMTEWDMPEMNGIALLKLVRKEPDLIDTPFILWTSQITKAGVIKAGEAGVNAILVEPFNIEYLESKLHLIAEFEVSPSTRQAKIHMEMGDQYMREKQYDKALGEYEKVLEVLESAEVYYNIGYIKTAKGEYDEALAAFRKATQINQMFAKAYKAMAEIYLQMEDRAMAQKYLQMAGDIFLEREMHESAESVFNEILKISPETINVYNSLGIIYRRQNRLEDAVIQYQKALKIDPNDENIHFNLGRAFLDLNKPHMTKQCFQDALRINPRFDIARGMLDAIESSNKVD